jgi:hypothetical protein
MDLCVVVNSGRTNSIAIILKKGSSRAMSFEIMYHQTHRFVHSSFPICKSVQLDPLGNVCLLIQLSSRVTSLRHPTFIWFARVWLPQRRRLPPSTRTERNLPQHVPSPRLPHSDTPASPRQAKKSAPPHRPPKPSPSDSSSRIKSCSRVSSPKTLL